MCGADLKSDPGPIEVIRWGGELPDKRRALIGFSTGTLIALGGNLFGVSSFLFGLDGGSLAAKIRADALFPVKGFKRCVDYQNGFGPSYFILWLS